MHDGNFSHSQGRGQGHVGDDRQSLTGLIFYVRFIEQSLGTDMFLTDPSCQLFFEPSTNFYALLRYTKPWGKSNLL